MIARLKILITAGMITLAAISNAQAGKVTPLFSIDEPIEITLTGPIRDLVRAAPRSTEPYPAQLTFGTERHAIELSARGHSRRNPVNCRFPPLRIQFSEKPSKDSLFRKQGKLKLVTHCKKTKSYQQLYLLEYTAYKLFNVITPASFRVRLANVTYIDEPSGKEIITRTGFFIEDVDDLAKRNDLVEIETPSAARSQLDRKAAAEMILFSYMIGNLDWSVLEGIDGKDCCHNGKIIGSEATPTIGLIPAPYDFDYSGFVDAPYAIPPENMNFSSVRRRVFRGFCEFNGDTFAAAAAFRLKRSALLTEISNTPGLDERSTKKATKYLEQFFEDIETDADVEKNLLRECRS